MNITRNNLIITSLVLSLNGWTAQAALLSRAGGTMVYDTDLNVTWVADANLFKTLANASGDANLYVQSVISANNGVVYSTPNIYSDVNGAYTLTSADFNISTGGMTWFGSMAWANTLVYGGYSDWRLSTTSSYNPNDAELGHLVYSELGGNIGSNIPDTPYFINEQPGSYWLNLEYASNPAGALLFNTSYTDIRFTSKLAPYLHSWVVRSGDVVSTAGDLSSVPLPSSILLFGSVVAGFVWAGRRKNDSHEFGS